MHSFLKLSNSSLGICTTTSLPIHLKWQRGIILHQSEWPSTKSLQTINAGEGVEKGNPFLLLMGMQIDTATMKNSMEVLFKPRNKTTIWSSNPTIGNIPWGNHNWKRPTRFPCPWNFPGKSGRVGCHFLPQGIFLTWGSNPDLPHCTQKLPLSHQGSPMKKIQY